MTRFEKDLKDKLTAEGRACKNAFRRTCIAQEIARLTREYNAISENF